MTNLSGLFVAVLALVPISLFGANPPRTLIVAHRGLLLHAPENTLANFRACLELRLGFEFDLERTKDGQLVCIHDNTVDRTPNGTGKVSDLTLDEIRRLDAGSWFDAKLAGEKVPTIEEVMKLVAEYQHHDVLIAVDLKAESVEQETVRSAKKHKVPEGARKMLQAALEREVQDFLEQHAYGVDDQGRRLVVRNGHLPTREIVTRAGECGRGILHFNGPLNGSS